MRTMRLFLLGLLSLLGAAAGLRARPGRGAAPRQLRALERLRQAAPSAVLALVLATAGPAPSRAGYGGFELEDLPPASQKVLLSQAGKLVFAADAYLFDVEEDIANPARWADALSMLEGGRDPRFASVSRVERDIVAPLRSLAQGIPEDAGGSDIDVAARQLDAAMSRLRVLVGANAVTTFDNAAASGSQVPEAVVKEALGYWEDGRQGLNVAIDIVNQLADGSAAKKIDPVPKVGEGNTKRSRDRYLGYKRDAAKCQQGGLGANVCQGLMDKYIGSSK
mmetsp:Transcript_35689/g.112150  ORF Transcript_35689/g.112150 Transcript_35689/m.112150 type:complete len:279 (-) Transcript_35689:182-1018(-)